ncbi:MAG: DUF1924 domain-containing protein [Alphaproteobacteria bacterium]|nr:DUF1924 domain-containing protein [Alphaproteobacteria bacterium]
MKIRIIVPLHPKLIIAVLALSLLPIQGSASELRQQIIAGFAQDAKLKNSGFAGFSAGRGQTLFLSKPATGKPDTPSCTTCHSINPAAKGQTRAGKEIAPMAVSKTPERFTDSKKVEKWFRRNCKSVLGRICTALEKGDFVTFMSNQ